MPVASTELTVFTDTSGGVFFLSSTREAFKAAGALRNVAEYSGAMHPVTSVGVTCVKFTGLAGSVSLAPLTPLIVPHTSWVTTVVAGGVVVVRLRYPPDVVTDPLTVAACSEATSDATEAVVTTIVSAASAKGANSAISAVA